MLTYQKSFFITLTSNTSFDLYPQNTLSRFTTKLPISLDFKNDEDWSVGIVKFSCTKIEAKPNTTPPPPQPTIVFTNAKKEIADTSLIPKLVVVRKPDEYVFEIIDILRQHPELFSLIKKKNFFDRYASDVILPVYTFGGNTAEILVETHRCVVSIDKEYTVRNLFDAIFYQIPKEVRGKAIDDLKKSILNKTPKVLDTKALVEIKRLTKIKQPEIVILPEDHGIPNYMCIYCEITNVW